MNDADYFRNRRRMAYVCVISLVGTLVYLLTGLAPETVHVALIDTILYVLGAVVLGYTASATIDDFKRNKRDAG